MAKLKLRDGYELVQVIEGEGIVKVFARKKDGSEEDVEVAKILDGKYVIDDEKNAKLVYQVMNELDRFGIYASESGLPGEEDFDVTSESALADFVEVVNI